MTSFFATVAGLRNLYEGPPRVEAWCALTPAAPLARWAVEHLHEAADGAAWVRALLRHDLLGERDSDQHPDWRGLPLTPLTHWIGTQPDLAVEILDALPFPTTDLWVGQLLRATEGLPVDQRLPLAQAASTWVRNRDDVDLAGRALGALCLALLRHPTEPCQVAGRDLLDALLRALPAGGSTFHPALRLKSYQAEQLVQKAAALPSTSVELWLDLLDASIRSTGREVTHHFDGSDHWLGSHHSELAALAQAVLVAANRRAGADSDESRQIDRLLADYPWPVGWRLRVRFACGTPGPRRHLLRALALHGTEVWAGEVTNPPIGRLFLTVQRALPDLVPILVERIEAGPEANDPDGWSQALEWLAKRGRADLALQARQDWIHARLQHVLPSDDPRLAALRPQVESEPDPDPLPEAPAAVAQLYAVLLPSASWTEGDPGSRLRGAVKTQVDEWIRTCPLLLEDAARLPPWLPLILDELSIRDEGWRADVDLARPVLALARSVAWLAGDTAPTAALRVAERFLDHHRTQLSKADGLALASIAVAGLRAPGAPPADRDSPIDQAMIPAASRAVGVAIRLAQHMAEARSKENGPGGEPWVRWLIRHIGNALNQGHTSIHAALGLWFPQLVRLSALTAKEWAPQIFGGPYGADRPIALRAYLEGTRPYDAVLPYVRAYLVKAAAAGRSDGEPHDEDSRLANHVGTYLWRGLLEPEDELVQAVLDSPNHELARWLLHDLGRGLCEVEQAPPSQTIERLQSTWLAAAQKPLSDEALGAFGQWCLSPHLPVAWRLQHLGPVLDRFPRLEELAEVVEWLVSIDDQLATELGLRLVTTACEAEPGVSHWLDPAAHIRPLLNAATQLPQLHAAALAMADVLASQSTVWWTLESAVRVLVAPSLAN